MGGKKAQTIGYYTFLGVHFVICHGPIDQVSEILADKKLAWSGTWTGGEITFFALSLFGGNEKEGGLAGPTDLLMGGPTQGQNAYLVSKLPGQLVPAFRGLVSIIAKQWYWGTTTYLKNVAFRAKRIHIRQSGGLPQWYDAKAEIVADPGNAGEFIAGIMLQNGSSGILKSADGITWIHTFLSTGSLSKVIAVPTDRYIFSLSSSLSKTIDGNSTTSSGMTSPLGIQDTVIYFKNTWLIVLKDGPSTGHEYAYSTDKGASWTPVTGSRNLVTSAVSLLTLVAFASTTVVYFTDPTLGWTTGGVHGFFVSPGTVAIASDGIKHIAVGQITGTGFLRIISISSSGIVTVETNPSGFPANIVNGFGIAYGGGMWLAVVTTSTNVSRVIYKTTGSWQISTGFGTPSNSSFVWYAFGRFYLNRAGVACWTTDGETFTNVVFPAGSSGPMLGVADGVTFDTRAPGVGAMNPAHIIRECLTDPDWGMGYQDADIDDIAFAAAANTLWNESMGMCLLWNKQETIQAFVDMIIKHIDGSLYIDRTTGKFVLKLVRFDYSVGSLITLNSTNIDKIDNFVRPHISELVNQVTVKYHDQITNTEAAVTIQEIGLVQIQGGVVPVTIDYPGFTRADIATKVCERDLRVLCTPIASCTIYCNRVAKDLNIGSVFKLTWPDYNITDLVMRVTGIAFGDGNNNKIRIQCTQDVYTTPLTPILVPTPSIWVDPSQPAVVVTDRKPYEVPYLEAIQQESQSTIDGELAINPDIGYAGIAARRPNGYQINADLYTNSGAGYFQADTVDYSPTGTLVGALDQLSETFTLANMDDVSSVPAGVWLQMDDEIMVFVSLVGSLLTVKRGALDTVPVAHINGAIAYFWDQYSANDPTEYMDTEVIGMKLVSRTASSLYDLTLAPADNLTMDSRMIRPYPPANVKVNGFYYPGNIDTSIALTWVHRDRTQQTGGTYLGFKDATIGPEAGTTYTARLYDHATSTLLTTQSGITVDNVDLTSFRGSSTDLRVELESVRAGYLSMQKHVIRLLWTTSSGGLRYLEDGTTVRTLEDSTQRYLE